MAEAKKMGRPAKPAAERKRHNQTFRINDATKERLEQAADQNQRSVSEEIEVRLSQSFANDQILGLILGDGPSAEMWRLAAKVQFHALRACRDYGFTEEKTRVVVLAALYRILTVYFWDGKELPQSTHIGIHGKPVRIRDRLPEHIGVGLADDEMHADGDPMLQALCSDIVAEVWTRGRPAMGDKSNAEVRNEHGFRWPS